jgi:hypothetical protein
VRSGWSIRGPCATRTGTWLIARRASRCAGAISCRLRPSRFPGTTQGVLPEGERPGHRAELRGLEPLTPTLPGGWWVFGGVHQGTSLQVRCLCGHRRTFANNPEHLSSATVVAPRGGCFTDAPTSPRPWPQGMRSAKTGPPDPQTCAAASLPFVGVRLCSSSGTRNEREPRRTTRSPEHRRSRWWSDPRRPQAGTRHPWPGRPRPGGRIALLTGGRTPEAPAPPGPPLPSV